MQSSLTVIVPDNKNQLIFLKAINGQSVSLGKDRVAVAPSSLVCLAWLSGIQVWQTPGDSLNSGPQFPCQLSNTEVVCWRTPVLCNTAILDNELVAHYQPRFWELWKAFVLHRHSFLLNFVSVLNCSNYNQPVTYQTKFALALSIMIQVLKQALIPVDLEILTEVFYSISISITIHYYSM